MFLAILGYLLLSFIVTSMLVQLFPDGRFPFATVLLVVLLGGAGAWAGDAYLSGSLLTGALVGSMVIAGVLLFIFHRLGVMVQEPQVVEQPSGSTDEGADSP